MTAPRFAPLLALALLSGCSASAGSASHDLTPVAGVPAGATFLTDDPSCTAPRCFEIQIPVPDNIKITDNHVRILLPENYATSGKRYPVLYLIHDAPGSYKSFTQNGDAQMLTRGLEAIAVMPDGGAGNPGWYSDWVDGEFQWESYHINVLIPWVDANLRTLGDGHRAIAGPSMGGYGSMAYSARHPGMFAAAAAFSGAVDFLAINQLSATVGYLSHSVSGAPNDPIWGNPLTNYSVWQDHDPATHIDGMAGMKIYLACGNGTVGGSHEDLSHPELYSIEPLIQVMNSALAQKLTDAGVEHRTLFYGPGYHDWPYFRESFAWALPQLMSAIAP